MKLERVAVGDVLSLQRREVTIDPFDEYQLIGVYSFGKGIFHRESAKGSEIGDYRFFAIEPGDLVLSNIQAWEGAIGLATEKDAGTVGTHRFLSYRASSGRIDTNWARWFFLSEPGMELIRKAAPGSTMRNRTLARKRFEALTIPLPSLEEQQRVAARLDEARDRIEKASLKNKNAIDLHSAFVDSAIEWVIGRGIESGWEKLALENVADVNPRKEPLAHDDQVMFVPMAAVDARTGAVNLAERQLAGDIQSGYKQFRRGDVIFARITPCMQNGKCAVFEGPTEFAFGSTEFFVIRPRATVQARWLQTIFRSHDFRHAAAKRMTGTAGQQRVPADYLRTVEIPVPPLDLQTKALAEIDEYVRIAHEIELKRNAARALLTALEPAILNQLFGTNG